jgi:DNA helicase MCM8
LSERRDLFGLFCKSLSPSIFGHELVKAGQILCLFGGTDKRNKRNEEISCREDARF